MSAPITTSNGITYAATQGAPGYGWAVTASRPLPSSYCHVVAGPYTNKADAHTRALELAAAHELELGDAGQGNGGGLGAASLIGLGDYTDDGLETEATS